MVQLLANLAALLLCLFQYVSNKRREWLYAVVFFLCSLLSAYYWTTYFIIMGDWPNVSGIPTYAGWNLSFLVLFVLLLYMKSPEERRFFHPLMLLPVPLNIWQLIIYLPYGELFNNIYQVLIGTLIVSFSIQSFCWYRANRQSGAPKPYAALAAFLLMLFEFGMWTSSCMYEPIASLYYPFSFLCSASYLFLVRALRRSFADSRSPATTFDPKYQRILKTACAGIVLVCSAGGVFLGIWIRNRLMAHSGELSSRMYDIIPLILFVISLVIETFSVSVILVVYFGQKATENSRLREARQIAERSSALKSEFLANMSHEIRTPINAVIGMNEIIRRESLQARDRMPEIDDTVRGIFADICSYSGIIESAGKNLLAIINDILDISRIESGKFEIREREYRLSAFLNEICDLIGFRAQSRNLYFHVDVDSELPDLLYGDELRVRQVVLNLLNNAVKYTPQGSVTLSVSAESDPSRQEGETVRLVFSVRDTGIGIREEDLGRLFDKFERLDRMENSGVEGTGLGLAICRSLLDMMNGSVRVESVFGKGSLFTVTIPQKIISGEPIGIFHRKAAAAPEASGLSGESFRAPEARILVVDDTRMNLSVAEGLLKNTGIRIDTALSGEVALQLTLTVSYDLILMDQRMPVMDGTETMHRIHSQEGGMNLRTPVVCLTADAVSGAREKYLSEGFSDYLSKPINSQSLRKLLIRLLPPEKIILLGEPEKSGEEEKTAALAAEERFSALRAAGVNVRQGLFHCQYDEQLYRSILWDYGNSAAEKSYLLQQYYEASAWKDYAVLVHAIKSTSGTVGASAVSEAAAGLEAAAKSEDADRIHPGHAPFLTLYRRIAEAVRVFCGGNDSLPPEDGDIIEFLPGE